MSEPILVPIFPVDDDKSQWDADSDQDCESPRRLVVGLADKGDLVKRRGRPKAAVPSPAIKSVDAEIPTDPIAATAAMVRLELTEIMKPLPDRAPIKAELIAKIKEECAALRLATVNYHRHNAAQRRHLGELYLELAGCYNGSMKLAAQATGICYATVAGWCKFAQNFKTTPDEALPQTRAAAAAIAPSRKYNKGGKAAKNDLRNQYMNQQSPGEIAPAQIKANVVDVAGDWEEAPVWREQWSMTFEGTKEQIVETIKEIKIMSDGQSKIFAKLVTCQHVCGGFVE